MHPIWVHSQEWGWYRKSKWESESNSGSNTKVQTKTEELIEVLAELTAQFPDANDLIKKLIDLIASNWREESLPSILTGWHFLNQAGLAPSEKSQILSTANVATSENAIALESIHKHMIAAWPDPELIERDKTKFDKSVSSGKNNRKSGRSFAIDDEDDSSDDDIEQHEGNSLNQADSFDSDTDLSEAEALVAEISDEDDKGEFVEAIQAIQDAKRMINKGRRKFFTK